MGRSTNIEGLKLVQDKQDPIIIYGTPGRLQGFLNLHNGTASKLTLKSMPFDAPELRGHAQQPINEVRLFTRLYPNQQNSVPFEFSINPKTPPGTYQATLSVGKQTQAAKIHISEHIELRVQPDTVTLYTDGERKFEREFVVTNTGNVAVPLGDKCVAPLQLPQSLEDVLLEGISGVCKEQADDQNTAQLLRNIFCSISRRQPGLVTMTREDVTLEPGETRIIKGLIELPANMQPYSHYITDVEMFSANVRLHIYTRRLKRKERVVD